MNRTLTLVLPLALALALTASIGCSDDKKSPTDQGDPGFTEGTVEDNGTFVTSLDASSYDEFVGFSFGDRMIHHDVATALGASGDVAFRREDITMDLNSTTTKGARLAGMEFSAVGPDDVPPAEDHSWEGGGVAYAIDDWYTYANQAITLTQYVYSITDASGEHWVKFRIDTIEPGGPTDMGTVGISFFFQDEPGALALDGEIRTASIVVGQGTGYFDFSTGEQVTPADPSTSLDWDIAFSQFALFLNGGVSGSGSATAFYAYTELDDPTAIEAFLAQPEFAQTFTDTYGSAMSEWYIYNGATHELSPKDEIYLIKVGDIVYKVELESYYGDVGGQPASAHYSFRWTVVE